MVSFHLGTAISSMRRTRSRALGGTLPSARFALPSAGNLARDFDFRAHSELWLGVVGRGLPERDVTRRAIKCMQ